MTSPAPRFFSKKNLPLLVLILFIGLFVTQRLALILVGSSQVSHPYFDEPVGGTLAYDFIQAKLRAPLFVYQYEHRSGDVLLEALLLVPVYKLFGCSMFGMKLLAFMSALLCFLLWCRLLYRYQGAWAAVFFAAFYAFPPPLCARLNVVGTLSSHHMINPLIAAQLLLLFCIIERRDKVSGWGWLCFGLLAGFGAYAFYSYFIFNAFCLLFLIIVRKDLFSKARMLTFLCGAAAGFSPWVYRSLFSRGGRVYLKSILGGTGFSFSPFVQAFGFNVPHSLSYSYPSREIGFVAVALSVCLLLSIFVIMALVLRPAGATQRTARFSEKSPPLLLGAFVCLFPVFFLICLSLSPMHINPFEYWPTIGLFATFSPTDLIRYRWFHILFPFYAGTFVIGIGMLFKRYEKAFLCKASLVLIAVFFICCGMYKSITLYNKDDFNKIFLYKGYCHDLMAGKFILSDFAAQHLEKAEEIASQYPEENKPMAYRRLGAKVTLRLLKDAERAEKLKTYLESIPEAYLADAVFGVISAAEMTTDISLNEMLDSVADFYPQAFYENWGFRRLGYKYYDFFLNEKILFEHIPKPEQWFFRDFLANFKHEINASDHKTREAALLRDIDRIPVEYQKTVIAGIGKFIGAEMLFDTLSVPDYPLDTAFGKSLNAQLQQVFFEGVGNGFAETLCRYWRRIMPPELIARSAYERGLAIEWQRCLTLLAKMPREFAPAIKRGLIAELHKRKLNQHIQEFITSHQLEI